MPQILVDGVRLAYHEWPGGGPAVLCVHGINANCHAWDCWAEQLAPAYQVIALDLRGRGASDKPPAYPVEVHRDPFCYPRDLDAFLDALGLETVSYIGHSLGAMIGVRFAAPTLILQAPAGLLTDSDAILSREEGERLAAAIPDARLVTVARANHYTILLTFHPDALNEVNRLLTV